MGDAEVEGAADDRALVLERLVVAEVVPQAERDGGELEAAAAAAAVGHRVVAVRGGRRRSCPAPYEPPRPAQLRGERLELALRVLGRLARLARGLRRRPRPRTPSGAACAAPPRAARRPPRRRPARSSASAASRSCALARLLDAAARARRAARPPARASRSASARLALLAPLRRPARRASGSGSGSSASAVVALHDPPGAQALGLLGVGQRRLEQRAHALDHRLRQRAPVRPRLVAHGLDELPGRLAVRRHRLAQARAGRGRLVAQRGGHVEPRAHRLRLLAREVVERPRGRRRLGQLRQLGRGRRGRPPCAAPSPAACARPRSPRAGTACSWSTAASRSVTRSIVPRRGYGHGR